MKRDFIRTYLRDNFHAERWTTDKVLDEYNITDNSAFMELASNNSHAGIYMDNDLPANATYVNINPEYRNLYNAILVAEMNLYSTSPKKTRPWGFLCIDTISGKFSEADAWLANSISKELMRSMQGIVEDQGLEALHQISR